MQVKNLYIETLKGRKLINDLSFVLNKGDKIAIIGEEGNGKSTLMKAIYNKNLVSSFAKVSGKIFKSERIGFLEQKLDVFWDNFLVSDFFAYETMTSEIDYEIYNKFHILKKLFNKYNLKKTYLEEEFIVKNLSGGEKVKIQLIKLELYEYDVYFLDEPTNDLDIETLELLESFMNNTFKPILFISHDETLLENVANQILHIEQLKRKEEPKHTLKKCGYREYINERQRQINHQTEIALCERRELKRQQEILKEIKEKVKDAINNSKKDPSTGRILVKKMANVKAQENRFENKELTEIPEQEEAINLIVNEIESLANKRVVIDLKDFDLFICNKKIVSNINLKVFGREKIVITGKNGSGKSTLIKEIVKILNKDKNLKVGYFSQNYNDNLNYNNTLLEEIENVNSGLNARTILSSLKFTKEEIEHEICNLSEGQKAKALILKLLITKCNVLLLDEPTRNLSPLSNPVFRDMLKKYKGAIISVSHDRKYIEEVTDKVYLLSENGVKLKNF